MGKKALSPPFEDTTADSVVWRRKMLHILGKAKSQETQFPSLFATPLPHGEYGKPVAARHHGRTRYHASSQSPQRVIV